MTQIKVHRAASACVALAIKLLLVMQRSAHKESESIAMKKTCSMYYEHSEKKARCLFDLARA